MNNSRIEYLLKDLCADLGFCINSEAQGRIVEKDSWQANDFAREILIAEGLNLEHERQWMKDISERFIKYLGNELYESS